ncbi:hypothetical protein SAMN04487926_111248 [Paraburkholderia steynii]|uniref:Uncharacterized protein n=2 Tax=Paraburkholderia steynii TaxID=1245441 RepID=A0A7Z7B842_9BURK|nr:hypothetical protein SAMN04487926_111248 [Paraburkholderia steynii]
MLSKASKYWILILLVVPILGASLGLGKVTDPRPLVGPNGWTQNGQFPPLKDVPSPLQVPDSMSKSADFVMWRTWTPNGALKGTIESPPFRAPTYIAVPFARGGNHGYPGSDELFLLCQSTGRKFLVGSLQTFNEWSIAYAKLPDDFCPSNVTLVGVSNAATPDSYLSVATPFEVSRAVFFANNGFGVKQILVFATMLVFFSIFLASHIITSRICEGIDAFGSGMIGIGFVGMIVFTAAAINPVLARVTSVAIVGASIWLCAWGFAGADLSDVWRKHRVSLLLWLSAAMCLTSLVLAMDNGGGRWAPNSMFAPLSWSTDNENPIIFAQALAHSYGPMLAEPWYLDDRTPLLTVLLIIPQTLFIEPIAELVGSDFVYNADAIVAIAILAMWVPIVAWFATKIAVRRLPFFVGLVLLSPFALFNTVYAWGKIIGGGYILLAVGLMLSVPDDAKKARVNLSLIPSSLAFSYLAHSGNAIAALAFLIVFLPVLRLRDWRILAAGTGVALIAMTPWQVWTMFVQPHGNALTRYQLANDTGFDHRSRSVLKSMIETLRSIGWRGWLEKKRMSFHTLGDLPGNVEYYRPVDNRTAGWAGNQRANDFLVIVRTIGIPMLGVLMALVTSIRTKSDPMVVRLIGCGFLGIFAMTILIIQPAIVHHMAYGSVILLAVAGAMYLADRPSNWPIALYVVYMVYFVAIWIVDPILRVDHLHFVPLVFSALWAIVAVWMIVGERFDLVHADHRLLWQHPSQMRSTAAVRPAKNLD